MFGAAMHAIGQRSRSRIAPFRLHRPASVEEAVEVTGAEPGAVYMAGGLDLINAMKAGGSPTDIVHLGRVPELARIEPTAEGVRIGACVTHKELGSHPLIQARMPDLSQAWRELGNPRIRCAGTLGGNLMARNPAYDGAAIVMALAGTVTLASPEGGRRQVAARDLPSEEGLLVAVELPGAERARLLVDRSLRPAVSVAVGLHLDGERIALALVGIGCAFPAPTVLPLQLRHPLTPGQLAWRATVLADAFVEGMPEPLDDWRASARFRRRMIGVLLRRLLVRAGGKQC
jgi:carbon-monoxide dehydrogenase medium subunit